jgi:alanyl-tRNA synthetase
MFEMLGNWSFGDYFKKEAIAWAWEYLTEILKIDKSCLYVTVFEGDKTDGTEFDSEAFELWKQYVPESNILLGNKKDNFWEMGDTGPCGPCSEIHVDIRSAEEKAQKPGRELVNNDHPQVIEIWNLVFMQFNRKANGSLELLPAKHVDTGMGFERLAMVVQGKQSNYDTDVFQPIIQKIASISQSVYGENAPKDIAMRVIADHIRTITFSITDGQLPSNAKAGYVIRRILRRAVRYGYTFLGQHSAFMYKLIPTLVESMGTAYPELKAQQTLVEKVIKEEEESFLRTLETGIRLLEKNLPQNGIVLSGEVAFTLYDTYGFPLDLTELILREKGMSVNTEEFNAEMQKQKERARNAAAVETGDWTVLAEGESHFVGYDTLSSTAKIIRYRKVTQKKEELYQLVLNQTPFYGEMGGQSGDSGVLVSKTETIHIIDTKKENGLTIHICKKLPADVEASFTAVVNQENRRAIENNHTATHLLHEALREVLGTHVEQKGSLVTADYLRFDFSHFQKVTPEELRAVELLANQKVRQNIPLEDMREMPIADARAMGAMALFGEKYGNTVRVVKYASSVELCGGTHAQATGQIGLIRIVSESSIAAGVRRIEAVSAAKAEEMLNAQQDTLREIREMFNNAPNVIAAIKKTIDEDAALKQQVEQFTQERIGIIVAEMVQQAEEKNGVKLIARRADIPADMLRSIATQLRAKFADKKFALILGSILNDKPSITVALSQPMVDAGLNASNIVRQAAKEIDGNGGGQAFMATAGGKNAQGIDTAIAKAVELLF